MKTIGLISCTKKKASVVQPTPARALYSASPLFRAALAYCEYTYEQTFVISALHGLIDLDARIEPYDFTLSTATVIEREIWARRVCDEIARRELLAAHFSFHAGAKYREPLMRWLSHCDAPLIGLGIGEQLQWYKAREVSR